MGKKKRRKAAAGKNGKPVAAQPAALPERSSTNPPGQRYYEMPYSAATPRLINPDLGLHHLVARVGHNAAYEISVTLLDAPDHRLIRSGVLLAHRVLDGRGEWYITAPDWQPLLPKDRIELMGHADLPEELADMIRPLRRRATLGPVAALTCDRREFALRDDEGTTLALLRDDKVTVRRGGLTTARYREVLITPLGPGLNDEQSAWLDRSLVQVGATPVPRFPRLVSRLGAPATGPTDIPVPGPFDASAPFKKFVSQLVALRLRQIVEADLAIRGGDLTAVDRLADHAARLREELKGLSVVLDPDWVEDLYDELGWISLVAKSPNGEEHDRLTARLRSERYLTVLERLVAAVRSPKLADQRSDPAGEVLTGLVSMAVTRMRSFADHLNVDSLDEEWEEAWQEMGHLEWVVGVAAQVLPEQAALIQQQLIKPRQLLLEIHNDHHRELATYERVATLLPEQAFAAGRDFERETRKMRHARREFAEAWAKTKKKLGA
ncbi:MAG TPA: hypothetical protein VJ820_12155 [Propionibacteriaceae bacterium]|nr:hypothetical protein [Propionibacteriaceae bacterium]